MAADNVIDVSKPFEIAGWHVIPASLTLNNKHESHQLPAKVFQVLLLLVENHGGTVSHQAFYSLIWNGNENVAKRGLTNAIWQLRKIFDNPSSDKKGQGSESTHEIGKTQSADESSIKTVAKTGYELLLPITQESSSINKNSVTMLSLSAFACVAILVLAVIWWPQNVAVKYGNPENLTYFQGIEEYPSVSPDGKWLAFSWEEQNGHGQLFVKSLQENDDTLQQITFDQSVHGSPTWSSNNMELAFTRINQNQECEVVRKNLLSAEESILTSCYYERFHRGLDWANNGEYLVLSRLTVDNIPALFRYDFAVKKLAQISFPNINERDTQISIHPNSQRIAFVRTQDTRSDIYILDQDGEHKVSHIAVPIYGLTWTPDGQSILINALYQGESSIWQLDPDSGELSLALKDSTPFNLAINPLTQAVIYSKHKPVENIYKVENGERQIAVSSAGRDLYPSVYGDLMAFISSRSGHFDIWYKSLASGLSKPITQNEGVVGLPVVIDEQKVAFVLTQTNADASDVYIYDVQSNQRINLTKDQANYKHLTWSSETKNLIVSSDRSGSWQLWQYNLQSAQFKRLTETGASYGYQSGQTLYFSRDNQSGIWRLQDGELENIMPHLASEDWGNWLLADGGIYYVNRTHQQTGIYFSQLSNERDTLFMPFDKNEIKRNRAIAFHDEHFYLTLIGAHQADILVATPLEN